MSIHSSTNSRSSDPLNYFTDRGEILKQFKDFLRPETPRSLILAVKGDSGTGKSFLILYLIEHICPENWRSGQISLTPPQEPDFQSILRGLEDSLKGCVPEQSYQRYCAKKEECYHKQRYPTSFKVKLTAKASKDSKVSKVKQTVRDVNIKTPEIEVFGSLRDDLRDALIELSKEMLCPLCLFIDSYELLTETSPGLARWLFGEVLLRLSEESPYPLRVVTCGWEWPIDGIIKPFYAKCLKIDDFDLIQTKSYLKKRRVIAVTAKSYTTEHEKLVNAFYDLTKGHPLVLGLAVTYFYGLRPQERTAQSLKADRPLIDYLARVQFLDEHLVKRLPEPHLTLFQVGPILRSFDYATLQALLSIKTETIETVSGRTRLNDKIYERFLQYPFVHRKSKYGYDFSFHSLIRRVRLEALRHYPRDKEQLHRKMANFYLERAGLVEEWEAVRTVYRIKSGTKEKLLKISEEKFAALLEWFYHILQVEEIQSTAFKLWEALTGKAINEGYHQRARLLLELARQLAEEGEPFLRDTGRSYESYSIWYDRYLEQQNIRHVPTKWEVSSTSPTSPSRPTINPRPTKGVASFNEEAMSFKGQSRSSATIGSFLRILSNMQESSEALTSIYEMLSKRDTIWPDQIAHALTIIETTEQHIRLAIQQLMASESLPIAAVPLRYPLLMRLHSLDEETNKMLLLLKQFHYSLRRQVVDQNRQLREIRYNYERLMQNLNEAVDAARIFLEQIRFEERGGMSRKSFVIQVE